MRGGRERGRIVASLCAARPPPGARAAEGGSAHTTISNVPTIAVVDDEANIRETVAFALRREGYEVAVYADGADAWEDFKSKLPELVILDILMPRMDGLELCRRIRSASDSVPIIFLTSRDEEVDRILGLELGGDDYLGKPFSMRELVARVRVLFRRAARRAAPAKEEQLVR